MEIMKFLRNLEKYQYVFIWRGKSLIYEGFREALDMQIEENLEIKQIRFIDESDVEIEVK